MDKDAIRAAHRARRREPPAGADSTQGLLRELPLLLARFGRAHPSVLAGYLPVRNEPDATAAMEHYWRTGSLVVVPRTLPERGLEWLPWSPSAPLAADRHGLRAPAAPPRPDALGTAGAVILVPALAVDRLGHRIGQGGGYFDRALGALDRWPDGPLRIAVVHADEVVDGILPQEPHDAPVDAVLEPGGWFDCLAR